MGTTARIMLGAFKDFAKAATDLNKKEFLDTKFSKKATVKTKSADGVTFEGFISDAKASNPDKVSELQLNFKDAELELKNKIDASAKYTVDAKLFAVADGFDATAQFVTPNKDGKEAFFESISLGGEYKTADLNASGNLKLNFASTGAFAYDNFAVDGAFAFKATDDLTVGAACNGLAFVGEGDKAVLGVPELKVGSTFKAGDISLGCGLNGSFKGDTYGFQAGGLTASLFQQATAETALAAEFSFARESDKETKFVKEGAALGVGITLGSAYKLSDCATLKSKLTVKDATTIDFAWVQKLGKGSCTFSQQLAEGNAFNYGLSYTLDA